ncbi:uncharacterized protein [Miscanthus floridulus]|uniref:uncharacterized protein n=1 Tax=Miscanthus floridulus TaxID=154761 RepID=UPI003457DA11
MMRCKVHVLVTAQINSNSRRVSGCCCAGGRELRDDSTCLIMGFIQELWWLLRRPRTSWDDMLLQHETLKECSKTGTIGCPVGQEVPVLLQQQGVHHRSKDMGISKDVLQMRKVITVGQYLNFPHERYHQGSALWSS